MLLHLRPLTWPDVMVSFFASIFFFFCASASGAVNSTDISTSRNKALLSEESNDFIFLVFG
jgi:hypothetical protein